MTNRILHAVERALSPVLLAILAVVLPAKGKRRCSAPTLDTPRPVATPHRQSVSPLPRHKSPYAEDAAADAAGRAPLPAGSPARPYCPASYWRGEPLPERTIQRARRSALVAAYYWGMDLDRRDIHAMGGAR
ncbi:hypothetical protein [Streptomyces gobiensis]|uniref:hypothetical protein n=1 Tax=Streptomyces gobiensis TaxID=2875706 RepID=UPI001E5D61BE|nr:hypothetical protein [Streptomyces gobiensis]UGY92087.1 hypothetical protein test1122_10370 [Streptomyces gobiensis]